MSHDVGEGTLRCKLAFYEAEGIDFMPLLRDSKPLSGRLPEAVMHLIANLLRTSHGEIHSPISYYTSFRIMPQREGTTRCDSDDRSLGSHEIFRENADVFVFGEGEASPNLEHTVKGVARIGCWALAAGVQIEYNMFGETTRKRQVGFFRSKHSLQSSSST